jgi:hypothetical protein
LYARFIAEGNSLTTEKSDEDLTVPLYSCVVGYEKKNVIVTAMKVNAVKFSLAEGAKK